MKTVLLVDDEHAIIDALSGILEDEGFRVVTAANGREALARLELIDRLRQLSGEQKA